MKKVLAIILMVAAITALLVSCAAEPKHEHSYGTEWKKDATNHWHECSCGEKTDVVAHSWEEKQTKAPTCTEKGLKTITCSVCQEAKTEEIDVDTDNHVAGTWEMAEEETFLKPRVEKSTCTKCNAELKRTTDKYKSVTGYWQGTLDVKTSEVTTEALLYLSFEESTSSLCMDVEMGAGFTMEFNTQYRWTTEDGKRTALVFESDELSGLESISITGEDTESGTLSIKMPSFNSTEEILDVTLTRISEQPHVHIFDEELISNTEMGDYYDFRKTKCETSLHPELAVGVAHDYSDENNPEVCSICKQERKYMIMIYSDSGNYFGYIYRTKAKGITLPAEYSSNYGKYKVDYWMNKETGERYENGTDIHPTEDMVLVFVEHKHTWVISEVKTKATCTSRGWGIYKCKNCVETKEDSIDYDADNHTNTEWITNTEATLFSPKTEKEHCSGCNRDTGETRETEEFKSLNGFWVSESVEETESGENEYKRFYFSFNADKSTYNIDMLTGSYGSDERPDDYYIESSGTYRRGKDGYGNNIIILEPADQDGFYYSYGELSETKDGEILSALYYKSGETLLPSYSSTIIQKSEKTHEHTFVDVAETYTKYDMKYHYNATGCNNKELHDEFEFIGRPHVEADSGDKCTVCGSDIYFLFYVRLDGYGRGTYIKKGETITLPSTYPPGESFADEVDYWYEIESPDTHLAPGKQITMNRDLNLSYVIKES